MNTADPASAATLGLPADLGIERLAELRALLSPAFDAPTLRIDAGAVARVHGAALQLLAAFCRDRARAGHRTQWPAASAALRDAVRRLALTRHLQIEENEEHG
ncbi:MAG TPA: STAS domain-containing protein [Solimonas sp.]|nr:STAS domain-containing protein [Solimonas sp.]